MTDDDITMMTAIKRNRATGLRNGAPMAVPTKLPDGRVIAHNDVVHTVDMPNGVNGFRWWTWLRGKQPRHFIKCGCGWSGLPHYAHHLHVRNTPPAFRTMEELNEATPQMRKNAGPFSGWSVLV